MHALNHDGNLLYVELAADKDADSDDREQWAKANPSYPKRTSEQAIMRMRNNLSDDSFRRERLAYGTRPPPRTPSVPTCGRPRPSTTCPRAAR